MSQEPTNGTLLVKIGNTNWGNIGVSPVRLDIRSSTLKPISSDWLKTQEYKKELSPGLYLIRIQLGDQKGEEQVTEINAGETVRLQFSDPTIKAFRGIKYIHRYFNTSFNKSGSPQHGTGERTADNTRFRIYNYHNKQWTPNALTFDEGDLETGSRVPAEQQVLETKTNNLFRYQMFPLRGAVLNGFLLAPTADADSQPTIAPVINNESVRSLLSFMTSGNIQQAKSLHEEYAEQFLYEKLDNPVYATVGGYYLLKVKALDRIHHWANNLAEWFPNIPDGAIIHAWQMLLQGDTNVNAIKIRLLQAFQRGIPLFTEGLRLLYEGLNMLAFSEQTKDATVEEALKTVRTAMQLADMRQPHTTLLTSNPEYIYFTNSPWFIKPL